MRVIKSNFSKYLSEKNSTSITEKFLEKFYAAWGEDLTRIYKKELADYSDNLPESLVGDFQDHTDSKEDLIHIPRKSYDDLINNNSKLADAFKKLSETLKDNS